MSVNVRITQDPDHRRRLDLAFVHGLAAEEGLYFGIMNDIFCLEMFEEEEVHDVWLVLFSQRIYCRGVQMKIDAQDDLEFILNLPAGSADIACFYRLISRCCLTLGAASFVQEEEVCALEEIDRLREELIRSNRSLVHEALKADLCVFGCIYPITLDETLFSLIEQAGKDQADLVFERYMDHLQKKDCYYARVRVYRDAEGAFHARYALTEGVPTIFPTDPYLPFGYDQDLQERILSWNVSIITKQQETYRELISIPFDLFRDMMNRVHREKFDARHVILTLNEELMWFIRPYEIEQAVQRLSEWLSDPRELGKKPYSVEHTRVFEQEDGVRCHIFRYKKSMFSAWLLGIVSDAGAYSEMKEYHRKSEYADAQALLAFLQAYWKAQAEQLDE